MELLLFVSFNVELNEFGQCSGWKSSMALKWDLALQNIPLSK
jgi:hypothetical protein